MAKYECFYWILELKVHMNGASCVVNKVVYNYNLF